jgi:CBS domain-containing protein
MFMSSAALGGVFAIGINHFWPSAHLAPGAYALVAMAAVFGAASRATFAFIVFAFEITRDYNAILPLMLACVIADLIALRYLPTSIMTEKLARRGLHVPGEYEAGVFSLVRVGEMMDRDVQPVLQEMTVAELAASSRGHNPLLNLSEGLPVIAKDGKLAGIVTQGDLLRAFELDPEGKISVLEAGSQAPIVAYAEEPLQEALHRMLQHDVGRLPVVNRNDPHKLVGYLTRSNLLSAWTRPLNEEGVREHGWFARWRRTNGSQPIAE